MIHGDIGPPPAGPACRLADIPARFAPRGYWQVVSPYVDIEQSMDGGAFILLDTVDPSTGTYVDTTVQPGQTYTYYIVPANSDGSTLTPYAPSNDWTVTTPSAGVNKAESGTGPDI